MPVYKTKKRGYRHLDAASLIGLGLGGSPALEVVGAPFTNFAASWSSFKNLLISNEHSESDENEEHTSSNLQS